MIDVPTLKDSTPLLDEPDALRRRWDEDGVLYFHDIIDPALMRWVKAADALDAYLKCAMELAVGNREFAVAQRQLEAKARAMEMPEVDYFLDHFAPSFHKTLDEITE